MHYIKLPKAFDEPESYIDALCKFLDDYSFVWKHHSVDIFVNDYLATVFPSQFKQPLGDHLSLTDILSLAGDGLLDVINA